MITIIIFVVGFLVSLAVCYGLFAYTIHEMGPADKTTNASSDLAK